MNDSFSALQRAEIAEIYLVATYELSVVGFSALQRAEIAEMGYACAPGVHARAVSVLFNEPKLLKFALEDWTQRRIICFSALQRAEIAEIRLGSWHNGRICGFQCSSTSRNC